MYSVWKVDASAHKTEYTRDAYATVLGNVRALADKASPNFFIFSAERKPDPAPRGIARSSTSEFKIRLRSAILLHRDRATANPWSGRPLPGFNWLERAILPECRSSYIVCVHGWMDIGKAKCLRSTPRAQSLAHSGRSTVGGHCSPG
jgi:hypothetical protein